MIQILLVFLYYTGIFDFIERKFSQNCIKIQNVEIIIFFSGPFDILVFCVLGLSVFGTHEIPLIYEDMSNIYASNMRR